MSWQLALAAASAASGLFNAVDEATANRKIQTSLQEIQDYLQDLGGKLDLIEANTTVILNKLDDLPLKFRLIVTEVVEVALLNERYSNLKSIKGDIVYLDSHRRYRINKPGWTELNQTMTYLFLYENRVSQLFRLIEGCELTLGATRNRARPLVLVWLKEKIKLLNQLKNEIYEAIEDDLIRLERMLNNTKYIRNHNLSESLPDINSLSYSKQPNRTIRAQTGTRLECLSPCTGPCHCDRHCSEVPVYGNVPDTAFHNARDSHISKLVTLLSSVKTKLEDYGALSAVIDRMNAYSSLVESEALVGDEDKVVLIFESTPKEDIEGYEKYEKASDEQMKIFNDYIAKDKLLADVVFNNDDGQLMHTKYFYEVITPKRMCDIV